MSNETKTETPKVGDGATYTVWTDRQACTVVAVSKSGKVVTLRTDKATRVDSNGMSECQEYTYEPDPNGRVIKVSRRDMPDGTCRWKTVGQSTKTPGGCAHFGYRAEYHDYSF